MEAELGKQDYYSVGGIDDLHISNSLLNAIDTDLGGHPKKAKEFLMGEKPPLKSKFVITGNVIHQWIENRTNFAVAEIEKPGEKIGEITDKMIELEEFFPEYDTFGLFVEARKEIDFYKNRTDESTYATWEKTGLEYFNFFKENKDRIILSKEDKQILEKLSENIKLNKAVELFLFGKGLNFESNNEVEIYYLKQIVFPRETKRSIKIKAKIDRLLIDHDKKIIYIIDFKTTSKNGFNFAVNSEITSYPSEFITRKIYRQFAFYHTAISDTYLKMEEYKEYKIECILIVLETTGLNNVFCFKIRDRHIIAGNDEIAELTAKLLFAYDNNKWDLLSQEYMNPIILI